MDARRTLKRPACWSASLLAFALIATACGGGSDDGQPQPSAAVETTETAAPGEPIEAPVDDDGEAAPAPAETEPDDEPLVAPVDTTTTTTPPDDGEAAVEAPAEPEPQFGGTLKVAVEAESDGLNPAANNFAVSAYVMTYPVFDPVAYWDTKGQWIPYLAESFTPIDEGHSWQMKLREGVRFHDGTTLDADDVIATFNAQLADPIVSLAVRPYYPEDLSQAEAATIVEDGKAQVEVFKRLTDQYQAAGADGHDVLVLNMLPDLVDKIVATVQNVSIDRVAVVDAGGGGDGNGDSGSRGGIPGLMSQLPASLVAMTEQIEAATGVDILASLRRRDAEHRGEG